MAGLFSFLSLLFFAPSELTTSERIVIVRAAEPESYDRIFEPLASRSLKRLIASKFPSQFIFEELRLSKLEDLATEIKELPGKGPLRGLIFLGHGTEDEFWLSGRRDDPWGGRAVAWEIEKILKHSPSSEHFFAYFNSCISFMEEADGLDSGFETVLADTLQEVRGSFPAVKEIEILGHEGQAGFLGWWPAWLHDAWMKRLKLGPLVKTAEEIEEIFKYAALIGLSVSPILAATFPDYALAAPFMTTFGSSFLTFLFWHHQSKLARRVSVNENGLQTIQSLWTRDALLETCAARLNKLAS